MTKVDVQVKKITSSTWQTPNRHKTTWITFTLKLCDQSTWQTIELTYTKLRNRFIQCTVHYHWPRTRVKYRTCTLYIQCTVHVEDLEAKRKLCYKVARHMTVILYTGPRGKRTEMAGRVEILGQELTGVEAGQRAIHPTWNTRALNKNQTEGKAKVVAASWGTELNATQPIILRMIRSKGWIEEMILGGMDPLEKQMIVLTQLQTTTLLKWMFFPKIFFKSSLPQND